MPYYSLSLLLSLSLLKLIILSYVGSGTTNQNSSNRQSSGGHQQRYQTPASALYSGGSDHQRPSFSSGSSREPVQGKQGATRTSAFFFWPSCCMEHLEYSTYKSMVLYEVMCSFKSHYVHAYYCSYFACHNSSLSDLLFYILYIFICFFCLLSRLRAYLFPWNCSRYRPIQPAITSE